MLYNTYSESDLESETNFQQPSAVATAKMSNNSNFVRNNSIKNSNKQPQKNSLTAANAQRRRASECSYYNVADGADNISYYGVPLGGQKRGSLGGATSGMRRSRSNKSSLSSSSGDVSTGSRSSTCSGDDTSSTSSGQPNLPYPGFVEHSFKYLSQDARPRNWCLQLITNPYQYPPCWNIWNQKVFIARWDTSVESTSNALMASHKLRCQVGGVWSALDEVHESLSHFQHRKSFVRDSSSHVESKSGISVNEEYNCAILMFKISSAILLLSIKREKLP